MKKSCVECGDSFNGRADAKFCSDHCRSSYHNRLVGEKQAYVREVNSTLRKNRKILESLNPEGKARVSKKELSKLGFNFQFFTNIYLTRTGNTYYFCYEFGYVHTGNDWYTLVMKQEYV